MPVWLILIVILTGLLSCYWLVNLGGSWDAQLQEESFREESTRIQKDVASSIEQQVTRLRYLSRYLLEKEELNRRQFLDAVNLFENGQEPATEKVVQESFLWVEPVTHARRELFEISKAKETGKTFHILSWEGDAWVPGNNAASYSIFSYQQRGSLPWPLGADWNSDAALSQLLLDSMQTQQDGAVTQVTYTDQQWLIQARPIPANPALRLRESIQQNEIRGWLIHAMNINDLISQKTMNSSFHSELFTLFLQKEKPDESLNAATDFPHQHQFKINGNQYLLTLQLREDAARTGSGMFALSLASLGLLMTILAATACFLQHWYSNSILQKNSQTLINEQKEKEHLAKESGHLERTLQSVQLESESLMETLPVNIFRKDLAGRITFVNQRYAKFLGFSQEKLKGLTDYDLFEYSLAEKYREDDAKVIETGEIVDLTEKHLSKDGNPLYVHVLKAPIRNPEGKTVGVQGVFWDVTARKVAEEKQRQSDARFRQLVTSNIIGVIVAKLDGRIIDANQQFLNMLGYEEEDIKTGRLRWDDITPEEHTRTDEIAIAQLMETGAATPWEKEYFAIDGTRVPIVVGVTMLEGSDDECLCFILDNSAQKEAEANLKAAKRQQMKPIRQSHYFWQI